LDHSEIYKAEETIEINNDDDAHALGLRVGQAIKAKTPKEHLQVHG